MSNLWTVFLTGLLTGGLTCMAVQGGLLAATIAQREEERLKEKVKKGNALPIVTFLVAKLTAYTILGFLLGWFGSIFQLSIATRLFMQVFVSIFMIGTALNILNVHPIFRYFVIQPPKFLTRMVRKQSKSKDLFAPGMLGAFTVFIPCGTTQAMMALAIASGSPLLGAAILFAFVLGTSPVFFLLGYFTTKLGDTLHQRFMRFAAIAIILLAIFNLNSTAVASGSNVSLGNAWEGFVCTISICGSTVNQPQTMQTGEAINETTVEISNTGYTPNNITIKAGSKITLHIKNTGGGGCEQTLTIPSLGIQKSVPVGSSDTITFTAPNQTGPLKFMCPMGMYQGLFEVI